MYFSPKGGLQEQQNILFDKTFEKNTALRLIK